MTNRINIVLQNNTSFKDIEEILTSIKNSKENKEEINCLIHIRESISQDETLQEAIKQVLTQAQYIDIGISPYVEQNSDQIWQEFMQLMPIESECTDLSIRVTQQQLEVFCAQHDKFSSLKTLKVSTNYPNQTLDTTPLIDYLHNTEVKTLELICDDNNTVVKLLEEIKKVTTFNYYVCNKGPESCNTREILTAVFKNPALKTFDTNLSSSEMNFNLVVDPSDNIKPSKLNNLLLKFEGLAVNESLAVLFDNHKLNQLKYIHMSCNEIDLSTIEKAIDAVSKDAGKQINIRAEYQIGKGTAPEHKYGINLGERLKEIFRDQNHHQYEAQLRTLLKELELNNKNNNIFLEILENKDFEQLGSFLNTHLEDRYIKYLCQQYTVNIQYNDFVEFLHIFAHCNPHQQQALLNNLQIGESKMHKTIISLMTNYNLLDEKNCLETTTYFQETKKAKTHSTKTDLPPMLGKYVKLETIFCDLLEIIIDIAKSDDATQSADVIFRQWINGGGYLNTNQNTNYSTILSELQKSIADNQSIKTTSVNTNTEQLIRICVNTISLAQDANQNTNYSTILSELQKSIADMQDKDNTQIDLIGQNQQIDLIGQNQQIDLIGQNQQIDLIGQNQQIDSIGQNQHHQSGGD